MDFESLRDKTRGMYETEAVVVLTIPQPPSVNALYVGKRGGGKRLSNAGRKFYTHISKGCKQLGISELKLVGNLRIEILAYPSSYMFDTANFLKATLDALEKGGVVANDRSFRSVDITHVDIDKERPRLELRIFEKTAVASSSPLSTVPITGNRGDAGRAGGRKRSPV